MPPTTPLDALRAALEALQRRVLACPNDETPSGCSGCSSCAADRAVLAAGWAALPEVEPAALEAAAAIGWILPPSRGVKSSPGSGSARTTFGRVQRL